MATPMSFQDETRFMCCQCFSSTPLEYATFDTYHSDSFVLVDVCSECRMGETYWMIRKFASYDNQS